MLDLSRDTASDIQFGANRYTCLSNLAVVIAETSINGCAATTYFGMQFLGQFNQHIESFAAPHTVTTGYDNRSAFQVVLCFLYMAVDNLHYIVRSRHIFGNVVVDYFALIVGVENFLLHHAFANSSHLRAVFGVDDGCHDVTAECGTNLVQQVFVYFAFFLIFMLADFQ